MELPNYRMPSAPQRRPASVGEGEGLPAARVHDHLRGDHRDLVPAERSTSRPEPGGATRRTACWPCVGGLDRAGRSRRLGSPTGASPRRSSRASWRRRSVVSTLSVLFGSTEALVTALTPLAALGFLVFLPAVRAVHSGGGVGEAQSSGRALGFGHGVRAVRGGVGGRARRARRGLARGAASAAAWTAVVAAALAAGVALALCRMARRRRSGAGLGGCAGCAGAGTGACAGCAGAGALGEQAAAAGVRSRRPRLRPQRCRPRPHPTRGNRRGASGLASKEPRGERERPSVPGLLRDPSASSACGSQAARETSATRTARLPPGGLPA